MQFQDRLTIDAKRRTADGYITVSAKVARGNNIQLYGGSEVGRPDLSTVRVYRPADEVIREGEFVRVNMLLADAEAIKAVEDGTRELSMGYDCNLDWTSGVTPSGEVYDAVQRGIRSNHVALVSAARGGPELRVGDSAQPTQERKPLAMMTDSEIRSMKDSVKGMPIDQAASLPIYDGCRGTVMSGMSAEKYLALLDGADASQSAYTADMAKRDAAHDVMTERLRDAWKNPAPVNDNRALAAPQFARDGRPIAQLTDSERAYEAMIDRLGNAHKN